MDETTSTDHPAEPPGAHHDAELAAARAEIDRLRAALATAQQRERALSHELQHRVRNMIAVIRSIYQRSRESGASQSEFAEHFEGRLGAVARNQSTVDDVAGVELEDMVRNELLASRCLDGPGCMIDGPTVQLRHKAAELMGLAIHELTTNAIKFGALAHDGRLTVEWSEEDDADGRRLRFCWTEKGVSVTSAAPRPSGFGRQLIEEALPYQLGASTSFLFKPGGIECTILLPLPGPGEAEPDMGTRSADEPPPLRSESGPPY